MVEVENDDEWKQELPIRIGDGTYYAFSHKFWLTVNGIKVESEKKLKIRVNGVTP